MCVIMYIYRIYRENKEGEGGKGGRVGTKKRERWGLEGQDLSVQHDKEFELCLSL